MSGMPIAVALVSFAAACTSKEAANGFTTHLVAAAAAHVVLLAALVAGDGPLSPGGFSASGIPALL